MNVSYAPSVMLEGDGSFSSEKYNAASRRRLGTPSAGALYIETEDLDGLYERVQEGGVTIADPLAVWPWGQAEFTAEDPEENWLTFWKAT